MKSVELSLLRFGETNGSVVDSAMLNYAEGYKNL